MMKPQTREIIDGALKAALCCVDMVESKHPDECLLACFEGPALADVLAFLRKVNETDETLAELVDVHLRRETMQ